MDPEPVPPQSPLPRVALAKRGQPPVFLALLTFLLLLSTGYLAYQNVQLKKQITVLSKQTPILSLTPIPSPNATLEMISFTAKYNPYFFVFPNDGKWTINETQSSVGVFCELCKEKADDNIFTFGSGKLLISSLSDFTAKAASLGYSDLTNTTLGTMPAIKFLQRGSVQSPTCVGLFIVYQQKGHVASQCFSGNFSNISKLIDLPVAKPDILSTFRFSDQTPTGKTSYTCPPTGYVDCMPILDEAKKKACSEEAMTWYKINCPDFKGGAL